MLFPIDIMVELPDNDASFGISHRKKKNGMLFRVVDI